MNAERAVYLDSSAIVKLAVAEPESAALRRYLRRRGPLVTSALARTEVARALLSPGPAAVGRGLDVLGRLELIRVSARVLADAGTIALISLVSPSAPDRARARAVVGETFREVHVAASIATCEARDPKHLYKRARAGEIVGFTGVDAQYDAPQNADLVLDTNHGDVERTVASALEYVVDQVRLALAPSAINRSV